MKLVKKHLELEILIELYLISGKCFLKFQFVLIRCISHTNINLKLSKIGTYPRLDHVQNTGKQLRAVNLSGIHVCFEIIRVRLYNVSGRITIK